MDPTQPPTDTWRNIMEAAARRAAAETNHDPLFMFLGPHPGNSGPSPRPVDSYVPQSTPPPRPMGLLVQSLLGAR